jgi:adenylosuccinate lyase
VVRAEVIARHVAEQLPFIASEEILMAAVKAGGDRQELHEVVREAAMEAADQLKARGGANPFLAILARDARARAAVEAMGSELAPERFCGRAPSQVERFVADEVDPILAAWPEESFEDQVAV